MSRSKYAGRRSNTKTPPRPRAVPRPAPGPRAPAGDAPRPSGLAARVAAAQREALTVTFWSESGIPQGSEGAVVRISGRRLDADGRAHRTERFVREEVLDGVPAGGGPLSITARVRDVPPGTWEVEAELTPRHAAPSSRSHPRGVRPKPLRLEPAAWSWRRRRLSTGPSSVETGIAVFAHGPGIVPGVWPALVAAGIVVALLVQRALAARLGLETGPTLLVSALGVAAGAVGAKAWYMVIHRKTRRTDGWCIQGFLLAVAVVAIGVVPAAGLPVGRFLDATTPALLFGMAVGRIGCFFAGCCSGRATCSRWGVWSSDRRIGTRRVPTQLLESALALTVGVATFVVVVSYEPGVRGAIFVAALSGYTLCRQALLRFRAEERQTSVGTVLTAAVAAVALVASLALMTLA